MNHSQRIFTLHPYPLVTLIAATGTIPESRQSELQGVKYVDPKNINNDIRIQKGKPNSRWENQRQDYVRWKRNGRWLDKNGKPSNGPAETHIPLDKFIFKPELFK